MGFLPLVSLLFYALVALLLGNFCGILPLWGVMACVAASDMLSFWHAMTGARWAQNARVVVYGIVGLVLARIGIFDHPFVFFGILACMTAIDVLSALTADKIGE